MTVEDVTHRIDVFRLRKDGCLVGGRSGTISWSHNGKACGSIGFEYKAGRLILRYLFGKQPVEQEVIVTSVPGVRGGSYPLFVCPNCINRVRVLYAPGPHFCCRRCYNLHYPSQRESATYRLIRKARKIRDRLGADSNLMVPVWKKPKGMHWKTFAWLKALEQHYNDRSWGLSALRWL